MTEQALSQRWQGGNATAGNLRHDFAARGNDQYQTPVVAVEALVQAESLPRYIWEPFCGAGNVVKVLRRHGHIVRASDLYDCRCPDAWTGVDFLQTREAPALYDCIVSNPPYKYANAFVAHALTLVSKVVLLMRLGFLEGTGRSHLIEGGSLARVHVFRNRLPMMHREGWTGPKVGSAIAFGWFVWDVYHKGAPTVLKRLSWKHPTAANDNEPSFSS